MAHTHLFQRRRVPFVVIVTVRNVSFPVTNIFVAVLASGKRQGAAGLAADTAPAPVRVGPFGDVVPPVLDALVHVLL